MSAVRNWLGEIGLAQYADAFEANDIDADLLTQIDDQVLKDIGVSSAGHRLRLRNAIAKLAPTSIAEGISEVPASPPPSQAERRQLTVMFCDLVGSTALSVRFDPEELREEIRAYQNAVSGVVARYDGFVAKFMGDGVLAYFGYPRAHEDDAERAVRAGLEIEAAVSNLETRGTERLAVRIGIATVGGTAGSSPSSAPLNGSELHRSKLNNTNPLWNGSTKKLCAVPTTGTRRTLSRLRTRSQRKLILVVGGQY
jgi:SAM domain (Sterile alpha motif)/Adenylate and Guanylate cyclase catalytic domain